MQKRTEDRYRQYETNPYASCPSCRAEWKWCESALAWQAIHTNACRYIPWWKAQQQVRQEAASPKVPALEGAAA
jgi:hypothetical protein